MIVDCEYSFERMNMVDNQIIRRGIRETHVLEAMRVVPRHCFVPAEVSDLAYEDCALSIAYGQTISQPYIVALMTSLLKLQEEDVVLEVGTGSGYQAAVLSCLVRRVITLEYIPALAESARQALDELEIANVDVFCADGSLGYPPLAPYDAIIVTAAAPEAPPGLFEQLSPQGRLVLPVGQRGSQILQVWTRVNGKWSCEDVLPVAFVPLRGEAGWKSARWD